MTDLEKMSDMAKSLQQMQQQMEKMGKDLAEQLKNGQPEAAQATLQKMIDQLKSANLTPEQLNKMMAEVSKAVDPASQYGKVGRFPQAGRAANAGRPETRRGAIARGCLQGTGPPDAADGRRAVADGGIGRVEQGVHVRRHLPELGPVQATRRLQSKGGKPGSGVGTWADENGGWGYDGAADRTWDNSGDEPARHGRSGVTDRGDGELNDALKPTKVKGQFSPGGQMPSITLKGVSIKGTRARWLSRRPPSPRRRTPKAR